MKSRYTHFPSPLLVTAVTGLLAALLIASLLIPCSAAAVTAETEVTIAVNAGPLIVQREHTTITAERETSPGRELVEWRTRVKVHDDRGTGEGWRLKLTPAGPSLITSASLSNDVESTNTAPHDTIHWPLHARAGQDIAVYNATRESGLGNFVVTIRGQSTVSATALSEHRINCKTLVEVEEHS